jgi:preprotein translocase subunit SecA
MTQMFSLFSQFFDSNNRELIKLKPIIEEINAREDKVKKLTDSDFPKLTKDLKERVKEGQSLDLVLPEAFSLVREATRRTLGLRHFDVQLYGAAVLSQGKIAEQKTGEGKTLTAVPALYLHSLTGKAVHLVTVNDYLARRDAGWMAPVFHFLGLSTASIISEQSFLYDPTFVAENSNDSRLQHLRPVSRKEAYEADIVYGINSEFGFDYLRDNMSQDLNQVVQRGYYYAIVDEVDSVLIDEARTPHIISAPDESPSQRYYEYAAVVHKLNPDIDYKIDEKFRTAHLTDHGIGKIEKLFGISDIYEKDFDIVYHLEAALKARALFHREKDYIVKDNQVILVDEFTGRLMEGRRLSEGIHQAIEAKENVPIQRESKTLATVSLQNYFRMYERLSGMTGTAVTEAEEFRKIYKLDVVVIPTHNPVARKDHPDMVYKTARAKLAAVVAEIEKAYKTGQPVLVGTTSIEKNEIIGQSLKRKGIKFELLNAKNHVREAEIIADAGRKGAVTVATNMAGRGVDIVLGGEKPEGASPEALSAWEKAHEEVLKAGGLYVIGTERHESRRIDNQLRGRSGRQGDPGASRFFVSLDDEIMRLFGGDKIASIMTRFKMPEDVPLTHPFVSKSIENAQVKVEGFNFDTRKHLVQYDDVLNKQREIIYELRHTVLESAKEKKENAGTLREEVQKRIENAITSLVTLSLASPDDTKESPNEHIITEFVTIIPFDEASQKQLLTQLEQRHTPEEKSEFLINLAKDLYAKREEQLGEHMMRQIEKFVMISVIDRLWMNHLDSMDNLRQGIGLRGYAQKDPLVEYKNEGYRMFESLMFAIDDEIVHRMYKVQVQQAPQQHPQQVQTNTPESEVSQDAQKLKSTQSQGEDSKKLSRNDPCWCGSGKKWKKCHYPQALN